MSDNRFWKVVVVINGVVPLAMLAWDASQGELGANPVNSASPYDGSVVAPVSAVHTDHHAAPAPDRLEQPDRDSSLARLIEFLLCVHSRGDLCQS